MGTAQKVKDRQGPYAGQYVALDPASGNRIIAHGPKSNCVAAEARRAGVQVPVMNGTAVSKPSVGVGLRFSEFRP